jgi:hypothetical protein
MDLNCGPLIPDSRCIDLQDFIERLTEALNVNVELILATGTNGIDREAYFRPA